MPSAINTDLHPATSQRNEPGSIRWHRPLLVLAAAMFVLTLFLLVRRFIDPVEVTGLNQWDKPLKFSISILIYSVTWSWLIGQLTRFRRAAWIAGMVIVITLAIEIVVIVGAAAAGTTSHFNFTTPLSSTVWIVMGSAIVITWLATFLAAIPLFLTRLGDGARRVAIRAGVVVSMIGLGLGFLMVTPNAGQLQNYEGVAGAHTVGLADGGPGLPILGWSIVGGDLRIPHFIGMHALQAIPIALIAIELLSRRIAVLRDVRVRTGLIWSATAGYAGLLGLLTWQALRGQSIVSPDAATVVVGALLVSLVVASSVLVIAAGVRRARIAPLPAIYSTTQIGQRK